MNAQVDFPGMPSAVIPAFGPREPHLAAKFTLEAGRMVVPSGIQENVDRIDPGVDGWETEVLHELAGPAVHELLQEVYREDEASIARSYLEYVRDGFRHGPEGRLRYRPDGTSFARGT